jgi:membrane magnesium transporter 1
MYSESFCRRQAMRLYLSRAYTPYSVLVLHKSVTTYFSNVTIIHHQRKGDLDDGGTCNSPQCTRAAFSHPRVSTVPLVGARNLKLTLCSVYSAYEHSFLSTASEPPLSNKSLPRLINPNVNLPIDITIETLVSVLLLCIGVVLSSPDLKPIQWNVWAGQLERSTEAREIKEVGLGGGNPYASVEERPGFLDIRARRQEFAEWKRNRGDQKGAS